MDATDGMGSKDGQTRAKTSGWPRPTSASFIAAISSMPFPRPQGGQVLH